MDKIDSIKYWLGTTRKVYLSLSEGVTDGPVPLGRHRHDHEDRPVLDHALDGMPEVGVAHLEPVRLLHEEVSDDGLLDEHVDDEETVPDGQAAKWGHIISLVYRAWAIGMASEMYKVAEGR